MLQPAATHGVGRGPDHDAGALEPGDLHRHQADAGTRALNQDGLAGLQRAVGDDRVVHGGERDGQGGRIFEVHVGRRAKQPAVIGQRVFGERSTARAHDLVADLDALRVGAKLGNFTRPFHSEHGTGAAGAAMRLALGHAEVGTVEAAGTDPNQHLRAFRSGLGDIGDFSAIGAVDIGSHEVIPCGLADSVGWRSGLFRGLATRARHHAF